MNNTILNQPIAIDRNYLEGLIPNLLFDLRCKNIKSTDEINKSAFDKLQSQSDYSRDKGVDKFTAVIDIIGPILKYSNWYMVGTQTICNMVRRLENDDSVLGIVFNIDSGGGMVSGTGELCKIIKTCSLPTVAYTNGYMCSAAYDIAAACDARVAHPNSDFIGSIGTLLSYQDFSSLFEKYGAEIYEIYAPQSTEKNKEYRELKKGNAKEYEAVLSLVAQDFIDRVKTNLGDKLKDDGLVMKGKSYRPKEALKIGLIDKITTLDEVLLNF